MRKTLLYTALFMLLSTALAGQFVTEGNPVMSGRAELLGTEIQVRLSIPADHYTYIQSPYAAPVRFELSGMQGVTLQQLIVPEGTVKDDEVLLYGQPLYRLKLLFASDASAAEPALTVHYQLCDGTSGVCYPPARLLLPIEGFAVPVAPAVVNPEKPVVQEDPQSAADTQENKDAEGIEGIEGIEGDKGAEDAPAAARPAENALAGLLASHLQSPLAAFFLVMLAGLLASLTPCVYPIIPITIGFFSGTSEKASRGRRVSRALVYVAGMTVVYTAFGVAAALLGRAFGSLTNTPGFFLGMGALFLALSLSLFDVYEIKLPGFARRGGQGGNDGLVSAFLMGVVTGLVASPCVGPVVLFLLTDVLQAGNVLYGALLMAGFSLGMGILFLVLALFSSAASRMPKSGTWMVRVKIVLGVLVLASALYFLRLGLLGAGMSETVYLIIAALLVAAGGFVAVKKLHTLYGKQAAGLLLVLLAILMAWTLYSIDEKLDWQDDIRGVYAASREDQRPVFLDLYAPWCSICAEVERAIIADAELKALLEETFHTVKMNYDHHAEYLLETFGVRSLPWVLLVDGQTNVLWKQAGFTDAEFFLEDLRLLVQEYR